MMNELEIHSNDHEGDEFYRGQNKPQKKKVSRN